MLPKAAVAGNSRAQPEEIDNYRPLVGDALIDEIRGLARELQDVRICHINASAGGGGVAELLGRLVPLYLSLGLGLQVEWRTVYGDQEFFTITTATW